MPAGSSPDCPTAGDCEACDSARVRRTSAEADGPRLLIEVGYPALTIDAIAPRAEDHLLALLPFSHLFGLTVTGTLVTLGAAAGQVDVGVLGQLAGDEAGQLVELAGEVAVVEASLLVRAEAVAVAYDGPGQEAARRLHGPPRPRPLQGAVRRSSRSPRRGHLKRHDRTRCHDLDWYDDWFDDWFGEEYLALYGHRDLDEAHDADDGQPAPLPSYDYLFGHTTTHLPFCTCLTRIRSSP